jgi:hypothetical protein
MEAVDTEKTARNDSDDRENDAPGYDQFEDIGSLSP